MEQVGTPTEVILGVDTHLDVHVGVVIDAVGRLKGTLSIETNPGGYERLLIWARSFGRLDRAGIEVTLPRFHVHQVMQPNERSPRSLGAGSRWPSAGAGGCTSPRSNRLCPAWPALACRSVPDGCARPSAS